MGCCGTEKKEKGTMQKQSRAHDDDFDNEGAGGPQMTPEERERNRKLRLESAEKRRAEMNNRGLTKEGAIDAQYMEAKKKKVEEQEKNQGKNGQGNLQYKAQKKLIQQQPIEILLLSLIHI
eukprot:TRINITY_DN11119_c0_g1_i1.p2 TRINITY_DN11119_c0_g1~~TRINITY_DN11119_c0_g1_i1.p2  ORF type:complete len:121 (-),score=36.03 TRINITY_DN11119_c0_g1_i1:59-421(-)